MKNILLVFILLCCAIATFAYDFEEDGIYYNLNSDGTSVSVTYRTVAQESYAGYVYIPATVMHEGTLYRVTAIGNSAFYSCSRFTEISLPNSLTEIGMDAFMGCEELRSIKIPENVKTIGYYAFKNCTRLISITIPNSVEKIDGGAFADCTQLASITIGNGVKAITGNAFASCSLLEEIIVDADNPSYCSVDGVLFNKDKTELVAYSNAHSAAYTIPSGTTKIGSGAFYGCTSLKSVTIPNSVTEIGEEAFFGCTSLQSVEMPNSVTEIGRYAFSSCTRLTSIDISKSITKINDGTFSNCTWLTSVTIPSSVTKIGSEAFSFCTGLNSITCKAMTPPSLPESGFSATTYSDAPLYVPATSLQTYQSTDYWSKFTTIMPIGDADGDGNITVSDINEIINMMTGKDNGSSSTVRGDVDGDGEVTLADINEIIDFMAGK